MSLQKEATGDTIRTSKSIEALQEAIENPLLLRQADDRKAIEGTAIKKNVEDDVSLRLVRLRGPVTCMSSREGCDVCRAYVMRLLVMRINDAACVTLPCLVGAA